MVIALGSSALCGETRFPLTGSAGSKGIGRKLLPPALVSTHHSEAMGRIDATVPIEP